MPDDSPAEVKQAGIFSKPNVASAGSLVPWLVEWLSERKVKVRYDVVTGEYLGRDDGLVRESVPEGCDLVIVLGGEGKHFSAGHDIGTPGRDVTASFDRKLLAGDPAVRSESRWVGFPDGDHHRRPLP